MATPSELQNQATSSAHSQETCPVCWGYQEYDHKIRKKYKDKQVDVKNHKNMFLKSKRFVVTNIDGIRYKKAVVSECPECGKEIVTGGDSE